MKKIILVVLTAFLAVTAVFASEANEIKKTVIRDIEFARSGNLTESLKYYTKDATVDSNGEIMNYSLIRLMSLALDGKHPEEFVYLIHYIQTKKEPTAAEKVELKKVAQLDEIKKAYPLFCKQVLDLAKKSAALEAKTIKFTSVKVQGTTASASFNYTSLDPKDPKGLKQEKRSTTAEFRKENGVWKFYKLKSVTVK